MLLSSPGLASLASDADPGTTSTTTTLPVTACTTVPPAPTFVSIRCRLEAFVQRVLAAGDLGVAPKLLRRAVKSGDRLHKARLRCRRANLRRARRGFDPVIAKLAQLERILGSRAARDVPESLRDELVSTVRALADDARALQATVRCPDDAEG